MDSPDWLPVLSMPRQEHIAAQSCRRAGWRVFLPRIRKQPPGGVYSARNRLFPLIPRYIFLARDPFHSLWDVKNLPGVMTWVRFGGIQAIIRSTDPDMIRLLEMTDDAGCLSEDIKPLRLYDIGDTIGFKRGCAWEGHQGRIISLDNRTYITVELTIFGALRPVQVKRGELDLESVLRIA